MARYLQNSLLKLALLLSLVFILALQIAAASISFSLSRYPIALKALIEKSLGCEVSFMQVSYGLHQGLIFKDFSVRRSGEILGFLKSLQFRVALFPLVRKQLWINRIIIRDGWVSLKAVSYKNFLLRQASVEKPFFTPAWKRLSIVLTGLKVDGYGRLNSRLTFIRENVHCSAELISQRSFFSWFSPKTRLEFQLALMGDDLLVNNITIVNNDIKVGGAGIIYNLYTRPAVDLRIITSPLNIYLSQQTLRLSNIFLQLAFKDNRWEIKDLTALINSRYLFSLHGYITDFARPRCNLLLEFFKSNRKPGTLEDSELMNLSLDGQILERNFIGNATLRYTRRKQYPHYVVQRTLNLEINELQSSISKGVSLVAKTLGLTYRQITGLKSVLHQKIPLNNLAFNVYPDQQDRLAVTFNAETYGGKLEGFGRRGLGRKRPDDFFLLKAKGLRAGAMQEVMPDNIRLSGELSGIVHLLNQDGWILGGAFTINNGSISRFAILDNIADFLRIKSLKDLKEVTLSVDFILNASGLNVRRFNLNNPIAVLRSGLTMNQNQWITGTVNLALKRRVLEESDILRRLLSVAKEAGKQLEFEFRISGFPQAIRVELQESHFRNRLMERLSGPMRSRIEVEINKAMDGFKKPR